jgi:histidinol-phosphate aminotransferase
MDKVAIIVAERDRVYSALQRIDGLHPYPSRANFILVRVRDGNAKQLKLDLEQRGILVRYFNKPGLRDCIRISMGKPEQNDLLLDALRELV